MERKPEGKELEYVKGAILGCYNDGQGLQYFIIGLQCIVCITLFCLTIKMFLMMFAEFSVGLLLSTLFLGAFTAFLIWLNYILIFNSDRKERNQKVFGNDLTVFDVTVDNIKRGGGRSLSYWGNVHFADGSVLKVDKKCCFYDVQTYKEGLLVKILDKNEKVIAYDLIPAYVPDSKVARFARKELKKRKYKKYQQS